MKTPLIAFVALAAAFLSATTAHAQLSTLRMRLEANSSADRDSYKLTQSRSLTIYLNNSGLEPADVVVKWAVLGRDIKSKDIVTVDSGEIKSSLKPRGDDKLQTPVAKAASEEARLGSKGKSDDIGTRIVGHGAQLWQGEKMIAEVYEPAAMKAEFGKAKPVQHLDKQKQQQKKK
jgi:hypothetical protein